MSYKHYAFTAQEISAAIWKQLRRRVKPQSVRDHRNGKRKNPKILAAVLIGEARCALDAQFPTKKGKK